MELLGAHKVTFEQIRSLAIQCHALDVGAHDLFVDSTHEDKSGKTKSTYQDLYTGRLLGLAIALRTKFYQGVSHADTGSYVDACGLMYKKKNDAEESVAFTIKDVCDKIIHADSVSRPMEKDVQKQTTTLQGTDPRDSSEWELGFSVSMFAEGVLNWVQNIEEAQAGEANEPAK